jgi:endonuclease/exonuclease/phosphatase (EEP) superfamily protein YafD
MTKGLALGQIPWRPDRGDGLIYVDVVSVHLDFSRVSVRKRQIEELAAVLSERAGPVIVMGDFNSDWSGDDSVVAELAQRCGMQVYQPFAEDMATYPSSGRRLDWVLISGDLEFLRHEVLPHVVSDHHAVVADVGFRIASERAPTGARESRRCAE